MSPGVEYFYDYVSPYSYLADSQLAGIAERTGSEIVYRPILLGGLNNITGNKPPMNVPAKGAYLPHDLRRWAERYGLVLDMNPHFPVNTVLVLRAALVALGEGGFAELHQAVFKAMWQDGANLADPAVVQQVLDGAGLDGKRIVEATQDPRIKEQLKANTSEAAERGAFGAPTFFVGDEMFWGNDRLDFVEEAINSA